MQNRYHPAMEYLVVDAFSAGPFAGNPAAVVPLSAEMPDARLQQIAAEFNLSETAFTLPLKGNRFSLRWFTPTREVPLCGHATLAAAHALFELGLADISAPIEFITRSSGTLICRAADGWIRMDFPSTPPAPAALPARAAEVLGISGPVTCVGMTPMNLTLGVGDEGQVQAADPDLSALAAWHPVGVTITALSQTQGVDFVSRFFAPAAGIPEDPVTGSAHCALAPYYAQLTGRTIFTARQLSKRGGTLKVELHENRVHILGQAFTSMRGAIRAM